MSCVACIGPDTHRMGEEDHEKGRLCRVEARKPRALGTKVSERLHERGERMRRQSVGLGLGRNGTILRKVISYITEHNGHVTLWNPQFVEQGTLPR
jgi:hypothetical protein